MRAAFRSILVLLTCLALNHPACSADDRESPFSAAIKGNDDLKGLYAKLARANPPTATVEEVNRLRNALRRLDSLDDFAREAVATGRFTKEIVDGTKRFRALAWLHGWASFSRMVAAVSRADADAPTRRLRADLLAFDRPKDDRSALALLLEVYDHIRKGEDKADEPLRSRLNDGTGLVNQLTYQKWWDPDELHPEINHRYYIPSVADLIGKPDAKPRPQRDILSLWALVNLQLDTWRGGAGAPVPNDLVKWLGAWSEQQELSLRFNQQAAPAKLGDAFRQRIEKVHRFARFRAACPDQKTLKELAVEIAEARAHPPGKNSPEMVDLIAAAKPIAATKPIGEEALPQAGIWLRYVLLLSYRNKGAGAVASKTTGVDAYWQRLVLPGHFSDPRFDRRAELPPGATLRWDRRPGRDHFDGALADATLATYRFALWLASAGETDALRFQAAVDRPDGRATDGLLTHLDARARELDSVITNHLGARAPCQSMSGWASEDVRTGLSHDLDFIDHRVNDALLVQRLVLRAYETRDASYISAALQSPDGPPGFGSWNPNALPSRSFKDCYRDLKAASEQLHDLTGEFNRRVSLQRQYDDATEGVEIAKHEAMAADLGYEEAVRGEQLAKVYSEIAGLNIQIAELIETANSNLLKAAKNDSAAAAKALVLATRARDLAAAQVAALRDALGKAEGMVKAAVESLKEIEASLHTQAKEIRDSRNSFFAILKQIINVVGIALMPFIGPDAMQIANMATQAVDLCAKVSKINFNNFAEAAKGLANVAEDAANLAGAVIGKFGGPDIQQQARKAIGEFKGWVNRARAVMSVDAQKLLDGLKDLDKAQIVRYATALLNDLPIKVDGEKVQVEFGKQGLQFDGPLNVLFVDLLRNGGMIVGDVKQRVDGGLAQLPSLGDAELKERLSKAIDSMVRTLPDDLLVKVTGSDDAAKKAREQIKTQQEKIKNYINDPANEAGRKLLAQVFANGLVVVQDANNAHVLALERPIKAEAETFKKRIDAFKDQIKAAALDGLSQHLKERWDNINRDAENAQAAKNDHALDDIADRIPQNIKATEQELEEIRGKITAAEGSLEDAEIGVDIASLRVDSARLIESARGSELKAAELRTKAEGLNARAKDLEAQRSELLLRRTMELLDARRIDLRRAEGRQRNAEDEARRAGIDPTKAQPDTTPAPISLIDTLTVATSDDPSGEHVLVGRMSEALLGMLQWVRYLNPDTEDAIAVGGPGARLLDWFGIDNVSGVGPIVNEKVRRLLKADGRPGRERAEWEVAAWIGDVSLGMRRDVNARAEFQSIARDLDHIYRKLAPGQFDVKPAFVTDIRLGNHPRVDWFETDWEKGVLADVPDALKPKVLGRFRFRFSTNDKDDKDNVPGVVDVVNVDEAHLYFFLTNRAILEKEDGPTSVANLQYLLVPPPTPMPNGRRPLASANPAPWRSKAGGRFVAPKIEVDSKVQDIKEHLDLQTVELTPAVGDWTVYLLATNAPDEPTRLARVRECKTLTVSLYVPYLMVPLPGADP